MKVKVWFTLFVKSTMLGKELIRNSLSRKLSPGWHPWASPWPQSLLVRWHHRPYSGDTTWWHRQSQTDRFHGSTASGPPGTSEEEAQADRHLSGCHASWHQISRLGPLHFGEENGNDSKSLPHGAGPKERVQGGKRAQVGHPWPVCKHSGAFRASPRDPRSQSAKGDKMSGG